MQESKTEIVETAPSIRRIKDSGDGTTWEKKKKRNTESEMGGLCRHLRAFGTTQFMKSMTELAGGELCLPQ